MVIYVCNRCNKKYTHKGHYLKHLNRKNPCKNVEIFDNKNDSENSAHFLHIFAPKNVQKCAKNVQKNEKKNINNYICAFCDKVFSRKFTLKRHILTCKKKKNVNFLENSINNINLFNEFKNFKLEIDENLKKEVEKIKNEIKQNSIVTNNKIINNYNNISLIAYKNKPDLSHLTDNDFIKIMDRGLYSVPNLIKAIHFNNKKPENKNIYIPNIKNKYVMVWNGDFWELNNMEDVLDDMYENNSNILIDKMDEFIEIGDKLNPRIMKKFKRFVDKKEKNEIKNKIKNEMKLLLYNNKKSLGK